MDCKVSGSGETLMEKCMEFLVHTENAILSWSSTRAREDCVSRAL